MKIRLDIGSSHHVANFVARFSYVGKWNPQCNVFSKSCIDLVTKDLEKISVEKKRPLCFKKALDNAFKQPSIVDVDITPIQNNKINYVFTYNDPHEKAEFRMTRLQDLVVKLLKQRLIDTGKKFKILIEIKEQDNRTYHV